MVINHRDWNSMKCSLCLIPLTGMLFLTLSGCGQSNNVKSEIAKLNEAFPTASTAAPALPEPAADPASVKQVDVNAVVNGAVTALKNGDHVGAVTYLNTAQKQIGLTAQQHMAVHETIEKVYADLIARVAKGDPKAKAALAELDIRLSQ